MPSVPGPETVIITAWTFYTYSFSIVVVMKFWTLAYPASQSGRLTWKTSYWSSSSKVIPWQLFIAWWTYIWFSTAPMNSQVWSSCIIPMFLIYLLMAKFYLHTLDIYISYEVTFLFSNELKDYLKTSFNLLYIYVYICIYR